MKLGKNLVCGIFPVDMRWFGGEYYIGRHPFSGLGLSNYFSKVADCDLDPLGQVLPDIVNLLHISC